MTGARRVRNSEGRAKVPQERPIRVLLTKIGLDGHDRGAKVVMHILREAGMEVLYTGRRAGTDQVVRTAIQEDVDVIGVSLLNNNHLSIAERLLAALREANAADIPVVVGGVIPPEDIVRLHDMGVAGVFPVHSGPNDIVSKIQDIAAKRRDSFVETA
jgi:methylmalonyl-CoA mutase C-terminal domain/subunit